MSYARKEKFDEVQVAPVSYEKDKLILDENTGKWYFDASQPSSVTDLDDFLDKKLDQLSSALSEAGEKVKNIEIGLNGLYFGKSQQALHRLAGWLESGSLPPQVILHLNANDINDEQFKLLIKAASASKSQLTLNVSSNNITDIGIGYLAEKFGKTSEWQKKSSAKFDVLLCANSLTDKCLKTLKQLDLTRVSVDVSGNNLTLGQVGADFNQGLIAKAFSYGASFFKTPAKTQSAENFRHRPRTPNQ